MPGIHGGTVMEDGVERWKLLPQTKAVNPIVPRIETKVFMKKGGIVAILPLKPGWFKEKLRQIFIGLQ